MKLTCTLLSFLLLCSVTAFSQTSFNTKGPNLIKGLIIDSASNAKLINASVSVLRAKDSTLVKFTRATNGGAFTINNIGTGKFILLVTYPQYADYVEDFTLDSVKNQKNFGSVDLQLKSRLLSTVIVKGTVAAIKIKGDTTEFNAKAFAIEPNSKVEDLLKQLPGIQVDKDGKITAQGQTVSKVLVDGEEFFGDDPTLVTKNIRGDMVDKVQLYDKKSDQATFTGIDDGKKTKTINIKLKEDKKSGYFGKIDAGVGTDGFYQGQGLFNKFKGKKKMSAYGTIGNTGKTGLGWNDNSKLGTGGGGEMNEDGNIYFSGGDGGLDSFGGQYDGRGLPIARTGGLHYDDKWKNDKYTLNTNYKIGSLEVDGKSNTIQQLNLPGNVLNTNTDETFNNYAFRQKLDVTYSIKLDTTSTLKISVDGTLKNTKTNSNNFATSTREDGSLLNTNGRNLTNNVDQQLFNASAFYTKKLKKPGRTISFNVTTGLTDSKANGFLKSTLNLYNQQGQLDSAQVIDQQKTDKTKTSKLTTNLIYTEPLSKYLSMILNYGIGLNNSNADRKSFDQSSPGVYNVLNDSLSNHYVFNQTSNIGGLNFNLKKGKTIFRFGSGIANIHYKQVDEITGNFAERNFTNLSPQANLSYKFSTYSNLNIGYNGNQTQPTIDQLQPIRVNTNPLNVIIGNPALRPAFRNSFNLWYNSYKVISDQSVYLSGNYSFTTNPIVNNTVTDPILGKSTTQALNLPGQKPFNYNIYSSASRKFLGINVGLDLSSNGNVYYSLINSELNKTKSTRYSGQLSLSKYKEKKYQIYINAGPGYTIGQSSLQPLINNNGRGFDANYFMSIYLPGKIQIASDGQYEYKAPTQSFSTDFRQTIINASITKSFFKGEGLKLSIKGNDLLNQNSGFTRSASANLITQNTYTTIRRYYMLSVVWDFSGFGKGTAAAAPAVK
ncbi:outer membrane beta-barrel protein [Mucilaginibacter glaciei]|uniref:Outer membrane beta-barrel protein n=1 Tax=Mucilaginibacter glaciei TaxID=2772109 RepID=A0A926NWQ8_9SPHI|nr:outer membrane beta-barrel protein [Mucilaginibacter glaciei]MBD1395490.1 outer membrane beta-barrel protein [Mucilaginibacter glaciei]